MFIKLNQLNDKNAKPAPHRHLSDKTSWIKSFAGVKRSNWLDCGDGDSDDFIEISKNFDSVHTHAGLISYIHYAWANEMGVQLRPDMIMNAIISELANSILSNPKNYQHLFVDGDDKIDIVTVGALFDIDQLIVLIKNVIKNDEFISIICDTVFESDVKNASLSRKMTFACMGTPFYNYLCALCGIPHVEVIGSLEDWNKLLNVIISLYKFYPITRNERDKLKHEKWIETCVNVVDNIIRYCFEDVGDEIRFESKQIGNSKEEFFSDIFHYGNNIICGSGHDAHIVTGWIRAFYGCSDLTYNSVMSLSKYNSHTNYVCMKSVDTNKLYCQVVSLAYSDFDSERNILSPQYGIVTYEVVNEKTYARLAMQEKIDKHGQSYVPLSNEKLKEIVENGTRYTPAYNHYGYVTNVICDKCREYTEDVIGYGTVHDLCMNCVDVVRNM